MTPDDFMTVAQAAEALSLSPRAVQHRIQNKTIAATKLGGGKTSAYMISAAEVARVKAADASPREEATA